MNYVSAFLLTMALVSGGQALANTEELISSIHHGGNIFLVVRTDSEGPSHRSPGIYGRDKDGWRLIVAGDLLQDARKGLWVKQLKLSQKDELFHTLVVVDGSLYLVNLNSDPSVQGSFLKLGSREFPLSEVLTGQKRTLPPVLNAEDISVVALEQGLDELDFQMILVSVRCGSCNGDGLTFAVAVKPMAQGRTQYELVGKPWVLDYRYLEQTELNGLAAYVSQNKTYLLRSQIATDFLVNADFTHYKHQREMVESKLKELIDKNTSQNLPAAKIELRSGQMSSELNPSFVTKHNDFTFVQQYFLRNQSATLKISNAAETTLPILLGFKAPDMPAIFGSSDPNMALFVSEGELYLVHKSSKLHVVNLGAIPTGSGAYEVYEKFVDNGDSDSSVKRKALFVSTVDEFGQGRIDIYKLALFTTGTIIIEDHIQVPKVGVRQADLEHRIHVLDKSLLFDVLTPSTSNQDEFLQLYDRSKPLVDVTSSKNGKLAYGYAEPLSQIEGTGLAVYRTYAPNELISNPSGYYAKAGSTITNSGASSLGQMLSREQTIEESGEPLKKISYLAELKGVKMENLGSVNVRVLALDSTFNNGQTGFKLVVAFESNDNRFATQLVNINLQFPFRDLVSLRAFAGRKSNDKDIVLVFSYDTPINRGRKTITSSYVVHGSLVKDQANFALVKANDTELLNEALEPGALKERIVYDEEGRIFFLTDSRVLKDERRLEVFDLINRQTVKPNVDKGYKILWDTKDEKDSDSYEDRKVPWRLPPNELESRFSFIPKRLRDAEANYLWAQLFELLDKMASHRDSAKGQILVVPWEMKKYINELIITRYGRRSKEAEASPFQWRNRSFRLYQFDPDAASQDDILNNLDLIQKSKRESNMILADMAHIARVDRPSTKGTNFYLKKVTTYEEGEFGEDLETEEETELPHVLYLLAAGDAIQMDELKKRPTRPYSTLIVSTPEELEQVTAQAEDELEGGLDKFYETTELKLPTPADRVSLLAHVFDDKNINFLRLQFDAKGISKQTEISQDAQQAKLLEYAVMRVASEAENAKQDGLTAFVQFRNQFAQQLLKDRTVRRSQVVDKAFVERVLTSVFDIPVNLESLPPDDPIFILSRKDAVRQLSDRGVEGPFAIKARVIKTMLSVLKYDPTRSIPSSHLVIGESGSGKTRMVTGLLDWLFPIRYDFNNPLKNTDAQSLRINVGKLVENKKDSRGGDQMTFDEVRNHINNFLIHGYRGAIFLDDFHAAPEKVRTDLLAFLRTLLETQGLYNASSTISEASAMVPLRHLHLFLVLNPTENVALIDSFRKDKTQPASFEEILLASLSTKDYKIERSLLKRIGAIHNLMKFPHGAKVPALSKDTLFVARDVMLRKQKLVINSAGAIKLLADAFPAMDARTFLSTSSSALVDQVDPQLYPVGTLFHVIPGRRHFSKGSMASTEFKDDTERGKVEDYIQRNTKVMPLTENGTESQLHFIRSLVRNFRLPLFEQLIVSLEDDVRFSESIESQRSFLLPAMMAIRNHLTTHEEIPLNLLNLDPNGFGLITAGDRELFKDIMKSISDSSTSGFLPSPLVPNEGVGGYFPFPISRNEGANGWDILLTGTNENQMKSRSTLITRYYHQVSDVVQRYTKKYYYLDSLEGMPPVETWLRQLPIQASEIPLKPLEDELRELFWRFISDINDPTLRTRSEQNDAHLTPYAVARIFYYLMDKSITDLPWIQINKQIIRSLDHVVLDQVLGQSPGVKSYFFEFKYSPIRAASTELIMQLAESSQLNSEFSEQSQIDIHLDYQRHCAELLGATK